MIQTKLLRHQSLFMYAPDKYPDIRYFFMCAGYAAGKTSTLVMSTLFWTAKLQGKKDREGTNPRILVGSKNITFLAKTWTDNFIGRLQASDTPYTFDKAKNIIHIGNVEILLVGLENPDQIYGYSVFCSILDEIDELPTNVAMEAIRSINDRVRQPMDNMRQPFIQVASSAQGLKGLYQTIRHFQTHNISYFLLRARTRDNFYLGEDYIKNIYSIYNEKEVRCFLEGEFLAVDSGLVFPDYNPADNDLEYDMYDTLDDDAVVYIANDFNSFFCAAVAFTVIDNAMVILKDYKVPDFRRAPEVYRYDFPTQTIIWIPDMTFKEHFWEYRKELRSNDIKLALRAANPLIQDRVFATNKLFHIKRLFVCPICKDTKTALLTHQIDRKTGMPTKAGESSPDHISDCIGYAVHYILSWRPEFKDVYAVTLERLERGRKRNKGVLVDLQQSVS